VFDFIAQNKKAFQILDLYRKLPLMYMRKVQIRRFPKVLEMANFWELRKDRGNLPKLQSVTKLFGQNTYLDFIPPLRPNTMLITAIIIFLSSTVTSTVNIISPKATLLRGEGRGAVQNWSIHWKVNRRHFFVSARRRFVTDCSLFWCLTSKG